MHPLNERGLQGLIRDAEQRLRARSEGGITSMTVSLALADLDRGHLSTACLLLTNGNPLSSFERDQLHDELAWALAAQTIDRWSASLRATLTDSGLRDHLADYLLRLTGSRIHIIAPSKQASGDSDGVPSAEPGRGLSRSTACGIRIIAATKAERLPRGSWMTSGAHHCLDCSRLLTLLAGRSPGDIGRGLREKKESFDYPPLDAPETRALELALHERLVVTLLRLTARMSAPPSSVRGSDEFTRVLGPHRGRHDAESELTAASDRAMPDAVLSTLVAFTAEAGGRALRSALHPSRICTLSRISGASAEELSRRIPPERWHELLDGLFSRQPEGRTEQQRAERTSKYVTALESALSSS